MELLQPSPSSAQSQPTAAVRRLVAKVRFRHLQLLITLDHCGSLHAASKVLNLTQPSLSKALAEIESAFGQVLFVRGARGLRATPAGTVAIQGAARLLRELAHLGVEANAVPPATELRVGAPPFVAMAYLPPVLERLSGTQPDVRLRIQEGLVPRLVQSLLEGDLDALVTSYTREVSEMPGEPLRYEKLFDAEFVVIAAPSHSLARVRKLSWQRLHGQRWILPGHGSMMRRLIDDAFAHAGHLTPPPAIESANPVTNLRLVAAGLGISAVPAELTRFAEAAGHVVRLRVDSPLARWPVTLLYRTAHADDRRVQLIRRALGRE